MDQEELTYIERAREGDLTAFEWLVRRYQAEIRAAAIRTAPRWDLAEDLAQEIFFQAFRSLGQYRAEAPFAHWLRGVARNVGHRFWRDHGRSAEPDMDELARFVQDLAEPPHADESLMLSEKLAAMRKCLDKLTGKPSRLIELRHERGMTSEEIAREIGARPSAVRTALVRVRESLRECVERRLRLLSTLPS